jgi:hypothetical protein
VAGQAFEEMFLCHIQNNPEFSVGLITTLEGFQLISTMDVSDHKKVIHSKDAKLYFEKEKQETGITSDKRNVILGRPGPWPLSQNSNKPAAKATDQMGDTHKRGAVAIAVEKACMKREYFTSDVLKFGIEEENKAVFNLLAAFVLLCVESHETAAKEPLNLAQPNTTCLIREVKADKSFAFRKCTLPQ